MAFVYRAKRDIKLSSVEDNNAYPGEYYKENEIIKDLDKQSSEFQSQTKRDLPSEQLNTPGPGSYEKNILYYDDYSHLNKSKKIQNIYETVKRNVMPTEVQKFLTKNQAVAFNTRGGRFNYKFDELEREKNLPGPGSYSPGESVSPNIKRIKINDHNKIATNINTNNTSSVLNNISSSNNRSSQSTNNNTSRGTLIKKTRTFNSDFRTETIPSKGNMGYDIAQNGEKKMIINSKELTNYISGDKNDSVGPGQYNIQSTWDKNFIPWIKTKDEKNEKYDLIKARKNLSQLTQLEKDYLVNSQKFGKNVSKTAQSTNYNSKARIFNSIMNFRYDKFRSLNEKKDYDDFIFEGSPGPGYYSPDINYDKIESHSLNKKIKNNFNSNSPRFQNVKNNNNLGPGYYYNKTKSQKIEKPKYISGTILNNENKDNFCALQLSLKKEEYQIPGPGSYEVEGKLIHENVSNNQNFGVNDKRFKKSLETIDNYPGPGTYETKELFPKKAEIKKSNIYTNYKTDLELNKELSKVPKEVFISPGVGLYNPNIISTMEYNVKSRINPYLDEKSVGFGIQSKKGISFFNKENNRNIGPGRYYKNKKLDTKQNNAPFNQSNKRFKYEYNKMPGPGSYEINAFDDWNPKSHNILFV